MRYFTNCSSLDEAKQLYKKLVFQLHPDTSGRDSQGEFQAMQNEFEAFRPSTEKFKGEFENWNAQEYSELIQQLMKIPNITIEICGSWIWLAGDTKPVKELIKAVDTGDTMKRGFSPKKKKWYFSPVGYRKWSKRELSFEEIKDRYGYKKEASKGTKQVQ